ADGAERGIARDIVKSARHVASGSSSAASTATGGSQTSGEAAAADGPVSLAYPGKPWRLTLDLSGYLMDPPAPLANGQGATLGGKNPNTGMMITVFLEPAKPGWTAVQYRDDYWERVKKDMPADRKDIVLREKGETALLEFRIPKMGKMEFNHKSL